MRRRSTPRPDLLRRAPRLASRATPGSSSESGHDALRADIRRLSTMLGQTLVPPRRPGAAGARRAGPPALPVGGAGDADGDAEITRLLSGLDTGTAVSLTRAFSQYFQLANIAEQRHRARELAAGAPRGPRPAAPAHGAARPHRRRPRRGAGRAGPRRAAPGVHRAPHRVVPAVGARDPAPGGRRRWTAARRTRSWPRWSTCSGRPTSCARASRPWPTRHGRSAGTWSSWAAPRCPTCSASSSARCARPGSPCPEGARPLALGCWVGGDRDGNPNVTPAVTREVLELYADRAIRIHESLVDELIGELCVSTRVIGVSEELRGSLARDRRALPEVHDRFIRLNAARALPAQALLRPGAAGQHPRPARHGGSTCRGATTSARAATSRTSP